MVPLRRIPKRDTPLDFAGLDLSPPVFLSFESDLAESDLAEFDFSPPDLESELSPSEFLDSLELIDFELLRLSVL